MATVADQMPTLRVTGGSPQQQQQQTQTRPYSQAGSAASSYSKGSSCSTSTSPSLSPKSSPLHSSNDTLNSSSASVTGSLSSGTGSLQSSGGSSAYSTASGGGSSASSTGGNVCLADYLSQLIKDKKQLTQFPKLFYHVERLLDEEISKVRINLFHMSAGKDPLVLPEEQGAHVSMTEKVYVPTKDYPDFNFVGRILGPRGLTAKELEKQTGCKIMIRGQGSMRDKNKESQNKGKPNWDHLNDELHVLITVEDTPERARMKLDRAVAEIQKMLVPLCEAEDELKKRQLMELAILNGTYRDGSPKPPATIQMSPVATSQYYLNPSAFLPANVALAGQIRQQLAGNSLILGAPGGGGRPQQLQHALSNGSAHHHQAQQLHHQQQQVQQQQLYPGGPTFSLQDAAQVAAAAQANFLFSPYDYAAAYSPSLAASILNGEYGALDFSGGGGSVGGFLHR